jgi:hypothetical protein
MSSGMATTIAIRMAQGSHQNEPTDKNNYMSWLPSDVFNRIWTPELLEHVENVEDMYEEWSYYQADKEYDNFAEYDGEWEWEWDRYKGDDDFSLYDGEPQIRDWGEYEGEW